MREEILKYNRLTFIKEAQRLRGRRAALWKCECGNICHKVIKEVKSGNTKSCGCLKREAAARNGRTHGMTNSGEYNSWKSMIARCKNPKATGYKNYGGRGISVCKEWVDSFEEFLTDVGPRPLGYQLDRIDNNGNYCKENCRWTSFRVNQRNTRASKRWIVNNICFYTAKEAALFFNVDKHTIMNWCDGSTKNPPYKCDSFIYNPMILEEK